MSTYETTKQLVQDIPTDSIEHRLRCELGQVKAGDETLKTRDRIRAYEDVLAERDKAPRKPAPISQTDEDDYPIDYRVASKYKHLFENAKRRGKNFDLSFSDIKRLITRKTCAYTGVRLQDVAGSPYSRTIDRLDPSKGYVKGNVFAISHRANHLKNQLFELRDGMHRAPLKEVAALCKSMGNMGFTERD